MPLPSAPWSTLHHPLVRDLAWAVFSPSLIRSDNEQIEIDSPPASTSNYRFLSQLDQHPAELEQWMEGCTSPRIGLRFEYLWQFWINRSPDQGWEHIFNLQINGEQRTLGELDSVSYSSSSATIIHREFAVKFYLGVNSTELPASIRPDLPFCWVGPNVKDRLDLKRAQLLNHQLQLMDQLEARHTLPDHWQWQKLQRQALVRGRLYYPLIDESPCPPERSLSRDTIDMNPVDWRIIGAHHQRGYWLPLAQLHLLQGKHWILLNRHQWFAPLQIEFNSRESSLISDRNQLNTLLKTHFLSQSQPVQIAAMSKRGIYWEELERYFVVPDQWPSITEPLRNT